MDRPFRDALIMGFSKLGYFFLIVISLLSCKSGDFNSVQLITNGEFERVSKINGIQLVDVRTAEEYAEGHILNSINIDFLSPNFEFDIKKLDKNSPIIVYCQRGSRSALSALKLRSNSFVKVYDLEGGFYEWLFNGGSVKK